MYCLISNLNILFGKFPCMVLVCICGIISACPYIHICHCVFVTQLKVITWPVDLVQWVSVPGLWAVSGSGLALSEAQPGTAMLPAPPLSHHLGSCV